MYEHFDFSLDLMTCLFLWSVWGRGRFGSGPSVISGCWRHTRTPNHTTPNLEIEDLVHRFTKHHISVLGSSFFLCFFSVFFFKPNDSVPYYAYIWACSRGIPLIFGVVLPNFVYFSLFWWLENQPVPQKNIPFVAFLWSVSL